MKERLIACRNYILRLTYKWGVKPVLFLFDPEMVHDYFIVLGKCLGKYAILRRFSSILWDYNSASLKQNILGINFRNPVGLSAGFDKNASLIEIMPSIGFGFTEVGSITGEPCLGNPKPRLWRLKKSKSLAVYYGLKNDGCEKISARLREKTFNVPVGINIAKTNCKATADTEMAIQDYFKAYENLQGIGNYITINISCPNAYGGQPFNDSARLGALLQKIMSIPKTKPIFLKMSPDISKEEVDEIISVADKYGIDGFVLTNLTKNRDNKNIKDKRVPELGGLSGKVVDALSDDLIRHVYKKIKEMGGKEFIIIGCGGIFNASDAYRKIKAGASLVELITGMIYEGPQVISEINLGLTKLLKRDGYKNISEAVGKE